jgi:hypothetical protein
MAIGNAAKVPFRFEIKLARNRLEIRMWGFLDAEGSIRYIKELETRIRAAKVTPQDRIALVYYDLLTGFETGRVARIHGEWFETMRPHLTRVAIVTQRVAISMALAVAKLMSKTPLAQFREEDEAIAWIEDPSRK